MRRILVEHNLYTDQDAEPTLVADLLNRIIQDGDYPPIPTDHTDVSRFSKLAAEERLHMLSSDCPKVYIEEYYDQLFGNTNLAKEAIQDSSPYATGSGLAGSSYSLAQTASPMSYSMTTTRSDLRQGLHSPLPTNIKDRVAAAEKAAAEAEATLAEAEASLAQQTAELEFLQTEGEQEHARMELKFAQDIIAAHRALAFAKRRASSAIAIEAVNALVS